MVFLAASTVTYLNAAVDQAGLPDSTQRVRGVIDKNQQWSGHVLITDDTVIQDATITIVAGSVIEFAQKASGSFPTLTVGAATSTGGQLDPQGTAEKPVTFRSMSGSNPGRLVINIRSRMASPTTTNVAGGKAVSAERLPNDITWQHVRFEGLGSISVKGEGKQSARVADSAVLFNVVGAAHTFSIVDCVFNQCARLAIRAGDGAKITVARNRLERPKERVGIEVLGQEGESAAEVVAVAGNRSAAAIYLRSPGAMVMENLIVGPDAAVVVEEAPGKAARINDNYIHNTTDEDDGRYCLNCESAEAIIEDNIFRGGSTCVWSGSRRMTGNVFIAAPKLASRVVKIAKTHQLVQALPAGSLFERNILIGPAYALLLPQPLVGQVARSETSGPTIIRHNVFDGLEDSPRAIEVNAAGRPPVAIEVYNNLFLRVPTLVYGETKGAMGLRYADHNAVAPPALRAFDQIDVQNVKAGEAGWSARNVVLGEIGALRLAGPLERKIEDFDEALLSGKVSVSVMRQRLQNAYRPGPDSSLVRAGRALNATDAGKPPTIGALEPRGG